MSGRKGAKLLKSDEFKQLKALIDAGLKTKVIQQVTGRSQPTISLIGRSDNFPQYRAKQADRWAAQKGKKEAKQPLRIEVTENNLPVLELNSRFEHIDHNLAAIEVSLNNLTNAVNTLIGQKWEEEAHRNVAKFRGEI